MLQRQLVKKSPDSEETLTPQLKQALRKAELSKNQLDHMEAEFQDLHGTCEELQGASINVHDV